MRRPRRDCPVCLRKQVAVMADGTLWWHKRPGWGLWSDGWDCKGADTTPSPSADQPRDHEHRVGGISGFCPTCGKTA